MRKRGRDLTPAQIEAQGRMRAAGLCTTSLYAGIAAFVFMIIPFLPPGTPVAAAVLGLACGILGLSRLAQVGMGPEDVEDVSPIERVSVKVARRARPQGFIGLGLSVLLLVLVGGMFLLAQREKETRRAQMREFFGKVNRQRSRPVMDPAAAALEREEIASYRLQDEIADRTKTPAFSPKNALPEDEIARRLKAFLENFAGTAAAEMVREATVEPYVTFRRILREHAGGRGG